MSEPRDAVRTVILGAAGRDFHNFNVAFRDDPGTRVVAFTAAQIPGIEGRRYPPALAGRLYPDGIPIVAEAELEALCRSHGVQRVVFAYSDVRHEAVMHLASRALACGADFVLQGPDATMLESRKPVIAVCATRTGSGKSQVSRWIAARLHARGLRVGVVRHPMPYGQLERQRAQRFKSREDLLAADCTIEEREEYEPHLAAGATVYAGVDYAGVLALAEADADVVVWDGGNNDFPFFRPDLLICVVDALRPPAQLTAYHPGEAVLRMADVVVINKVDAAKEADVEALAGAVAAVNARAPIVRAASPVRLDDGADVAGKRALVVDDGPTITHGGMPYGAGYVAARAAGASEIVDPRESATPPIEAVYAAYPHIGPVLPAVGYQPAQLEALAATINRSRAEVVVAGTPVDLGSILDLAIPVVRARYSFAETGEPALGPLIDAFIDRAQAHEDRPTRT